VMAAAENRGSTGGGAAVDDFATVPAALNQP
jgi:hypothetical protein